MIDKIAKKHSKLVNNRINNVSIAKEIIVMLKL